jgi:hypothetical protein
MGILSMGNFLRQLFKRFTTSKRKPSPFLRPPQLTFLEERITPATITVSSNADAGAGTLRQAIIDANASAGDDTINFGITGTITLASSLPAIVTATTAGTLSVTGPGSTLLTISGNNKNLQVFTINSGLIYPSQALRFLEPAQVSEARLKIMALFPFLILPFQEILLLRVAELFLMDENFRKLLVFCRSLIPSFRAIHQTEGAPFVLMELLPSLIQFFLEILAGEMAQMTGVEQFISKEPSIHQKSLLSLILPFLGTRQPLVAESIA